MTAIVIDRFGGLLPKMDKAALPPFGAQQADDAKLHKGILGNWRKPLSMDPVVSVSAATKTIFYEEGSSAWLSWTTDVDIQPGPVADLSAALRYYLTGDNVPKKFDSSGGPAAWLHLGVPAPAAAASAGGGTGTLTRVWVYTNVSTFSGIEEESAPSPPVTINNWKSGDTITLDNMSAVPGANYNITKRRLYRSDGGAFLFVKEFTGTSTTDAVLDSALGEGITTFDFDEPPSGLTGLVAMANGIMAGFVGNELYFCEPYQPHAWPAKYKLTTVEQIVAIVPVPQGAYVLTSGNPYFCGGSHPEAMTMERVQKYAPCLSKRSVATDGTGAIYATYNGLAYMQGAGVLNLTEQLFTQEEWARYAPASMYGAYYDERYMLWFDNGTDQAGLILDKALQDKPMTASRLYTTAAHIRRDTGNLYVVDGGEIKQFDADDVNRVPYEWKSKLFILPKPTNFGFAQVLIDDTQSATAAAAAAEAAANVALWSAGAYKAGWNDVEYNEYPFNGSEMIETSSLDAAYVTLRVYAGGVLKATRDVTNGQIVRLPAGFKHTDWEVCVSGNKGVRRVTLATSAAEIAAQ